MHENLAIGQQQRSFIKLRIVLAFLALTAILFASLIPAASEWTAPISFEQSRKVCVIAIALALALLPNSAWLGGALACIAAGGCWYWFTSFPPTIQYRSAWATVGSILASVLVARFFGYRLTLEKLPLSPATLKIWDIVLITALAAALLTFSRAASNAEEISYRVLWPITVLPFVVGACVALLGETSIWQRITFACCWASLPLIALGMPAWESQARLAFAASDIIKLLGWCFVFAYALRLVGIRSQRHSTKNIALTKEAAGHVEPCPTPIA